MPSSVINKKKNKPKKSFEESLWDTANRTMPTNNTNGEIRPKLTEARIKRMSSSGNVIQTHTTLRDRLLPELISGEIGTHNSLK